MSRLRVRNYEQKIEARRKYADRIFRLVSVWLVAVFAVVIADGWRGGLFQLADKVMVTLLAGTTVNILGLFYIVANYLFPTATGRGRRRHKRLTGKATRTGNRPRG